MDISDGLLKDLARLTEPSGMALRFDAVPLSPSARAALSADRRVIAHELGHAFGLFHVPASERISLMNPGNLTTPPTTADQAALAALWGSCD